VSNLGFFSHLRNPFLWSPYFLGGWLARRYREKPIGADGRRRVRLALALGAGSLLCEVGMLPVDVWEIRQLADLAHVYLMLALLWVVSCTWPRTPSWIEWLSDRTYAVYLYHAPVIALVPPLLFGRPGLLAAAAVALSWIAGCVGGLSVAIAGRRIFGRHSRWLVGA